MVPWATTKPESRSTLAAALRREIIASEQLRAMILAALFCVVLVISVSLYLFLPHLVRDLLERQEMLGVVIAVLTSAIVFELFVCWRLGRHLRRGTHPLPLAPYFVTLVETSLPTITLLLTAEVTGRELTLALPSSMFYFPFILLSTLRLSFSLAFFTGLVASSEFLILALLFQSEQQLAGSPVTSFAMNLWKVVIYFLSGLIAGLVALQIRRQYERSLEYAEERNRVVDVFGKHVSPQVAEQLLEQNVALGGEVRSVCVLFLDIRNFTARSSGQQPEEVVNYLNSLFDFMIDAITRHRGIVNKFLGDGFMAIFGAPLSDGQDSANAVMAARDILERLGGYNATHPAPPTHIGIGLHTGLAVAGTIGSAGRREYTIIGDTVNLASRIESLNKSIGSQILISEAVWRAAGTAAADAQPLGPVEVRGEPAPVRLYKVA